MWILSIAGLLLAAFLLKKKFNIEFYLALPFATALMIMSMYVMAFFSALKYIDIFGLIIIIAFCIHYAKSKKTEKELLRQELLDFCRQPQLVGVLVVCVLMTLLTLGQYVTWWDDLNFWATDVKGLFFTGGFAGKYGNVAPEFGDYPPALQLFKWWFLHFSPSYVEGLQFAGYYCMNFIFLLPVIKDLKSKNYIVNIIGCVILSLVPGIVDQFWAYGTCADVTMGIIYGAVLVEIFRNRKGKGDIYFLSMYIASLLSVLVLVKTVAVEWALFAVIFGFIMGAFSLYPLKKNAAKAGISILSLICPILTEGSWMLFCLINRRVAKLTSAGVKMAAGGSYSLPGDYKERISAYLNGFWNYSMHGSTKGLINISSGAFLIIVVVFLIIFCFAKYIDLKETVKILIFALLSAFAAYGIILIGHLTIFQTENQYLEADVMAKSIERYGAPFSLGFIMLLFAIALSAEIKKKMVVNIILALAVLLTVDYSAVISAYGGYYSRKEQALSDRESMIGEVESTFLSKISDKSELWGERVLFIQDASEIHWVKNTYTNFYASPIPVVYSSLYAEDLSGENIEYLINTMHASYIYIQKMDCNDESVLSTFMSEGTEFEFNTVYEVVTDNEKTYFRII
ncbi:MAG: hypothetical protein K6G87_01855 [Butyrivibrio sp.]|uniref:hypothetical protein n=1 Tax=Butyrivibrio sp. TaxID=28121 RepID=UPI0026014D7E|nr:hypothetical protein [Butyrivibrio sp.]MCR5769960.1 hypothetical protein [Butyrivibrio sp.]